MGSEPKLTLDQFHALELWIMATARWMDTPTASSGDKYEQRRQQALDLLVESAALKTESSR